MSHSSANPGSSTPSVPSGILKQCRTADAVEYLGRYTHKIAISNHRLISLDNGQVTFRYKGYRKGAQKLQMTLSDQEFICTGNPAALQSAYPAQVPGQNPTLRFLV